jgi:hypothetical protein
MSQMGHLRRFERALATSAIHPGADISLQRTNRRCGPMLLKKSINERRTLHDGQ